MVARVNRWISFLLMAGMLNSQSNGLNSRIFWKDSMEICSGATVVNVVSCLHNAMPSE